VAFSTLTPLLYVHDKQATLGFWRDALGFEVAQEAGGEDWYWATLQNGPVRLMVNTIEAGSTRSTRLPKDFGSVLYLGTDDVHAFVGDLRAKGVEVTDPEPQEYGLDQVWLRDPDGYQLCVTSPPRP
jgi:glyoxylase I family protein